MIKTGCPKSAFHQPEKGRSLTEMLATLAIMAIITTAGIALFKTALNKHRANELVNEAVKRATVVAMQITAGKNNLSISEFKDPDGYHFQVAPKNENQFDITLDTVEKAVCAQMKQFAGEKSLVRLISDDCLILTFNNDLSFTKWATDYQNKNDCMNADKIWCGDEQNGRCSDNGNCCVKGDCFSNVCPQGASTNGERAGGQTGIFVEGIACVCDAAADIYSGQACIPKPDTCSDWQKNECGFGYYCAFDYKDTLNQTSPVDDNNPACYHNLTGTCRKITTATISDTERSVLLNAGFKPSFTRIYSGLMNWWTAYNFCISQGKHLIDVQEMGCYAWGDALVTQQQTRMASCCKQGQSCHQVSWSSLWNGKEIVDGKQEEAATFSDKLIALKKLYGGTYFWTATPYGNPSQNSCKAFYVYTHEGGYVYGLNRSNSYGVFCE